jgi:hypothetical protein
MLKFSSTYPKAKKVLEQYSKYVIQQGRSILAKQKSSKDGLYRKLKGVINHKLNRDVKGRFTGGSQLPTLSFVMPSYAEFVDQGVRGTNPQRKGYVANGKYSFKKGKKSIKVKNNTALANWAQKRGLNKWAVAKAVHQRGIKRSLFFTKPFEARFKRYINEYHSAVADDIANNFANQLKKRIKQTSISK